MMRGSTSGAPHLTPNSYNLHNSALRLADDLVLLGLGGSIPAYRNGTACWAGTCAWVAAAEGCA